MNPFLIRQASIRGLTAFVALSFFVGNAVAFTFNTIHTFTPASEGNVTYPPLVQGADGRLYGVNSTGGRSDNGTIFSLPTGGGNGNFLTLNTFTQTNQGTTPQGGLVQARDGNFYGTTYTLGSGGYGTFFQCIPSTGKLTILGQFTNADPGGNPVGTVLEGIDGNLYGTARYGGGDNYGTVFSYSFATGVLSTFAQITGGLAGFYPQSDLIQATDGNFYGTTERGGSYSSGTFFRVTPTGVYTVLYSFTGGVDGGRPLRGVVQGFDGLFYGVCNTGGQYGGGAIYRIAAINTTFSLTALYSFVPQVLDGSNALGNLVQASDGNFYGTTAGGGANGNGTVYEITPTGGYSLLYSFTNGVDGANPVAGLTQANDGKLYGTTAGTNGQAGTVFRVDLGLLPPLPRPTYLLQTRAAAGDTIVIKGDNFVGTSAVLFSGANGPVPATNFSVQSKTVVQAVVPDGAVTGPVSVVANGRTGVTPNSLSVAIVTPPVVLPTVTVIANPTFADKTTGAKAKLVITRTNGDNSAALVVNYKVLPTSTATFGTDYTLVADGVPLGATGSVTIPAGKGSVKIKLKPVQGTAPEPTTLVKVKLTGSNAYLSGSPKKAVVQIQTSVTAQ